jgi:tetratricopeptide (TPR) repeat protein
MRFAVLLATCLYGQTPDAAFEPLAKAYEAVRKRDYETAKDLAYTYIKIGESELAREEFGEAMRLDPGDLHAAKEYAFLCYETKQRAQARRIFDRIRRSGDTVAEEAFQNIDRPLREGIARWKDAIAMGADQFSAHKRRTGIGRRSLRKSMEAAAGPAQRPGGPRPCVEIARTRRRCQRGASRSIARRRA